MTSKDDKNNQPVPHPEVAQSALEGAGEGEKRPG